MKLLVKRIPALPAAGAVLFLLLQAACALYLPYLTAGMVDRGIAQGNLAYIAQSGFWMLALTVLSLIGALLNTALTAKISYGLGKELRGDLFSSVLRFSKREYDAYGPATLLTRTTNDVTQVQNLIEMGLKFLILCPLYLIGGIALTFRLNASLALVFLAALPLLTAAAFVIYKVAAPLYGNMQEGLDRMNHLFREGLDGVKVIRAFGKEDVEAARYHDANREYTHTAITAGTVMSVFSPLMTLIISMATALILWLGGRGASAGTMEIGAVMGAVSYGGQILMGFGLLTMVILSVPRGQISAARIAAVLGTVPAIKDPIEPVQAPKKGGALSLSGVSFRYPGADKDTLHDLSVTVRPGQTLAILGGTGDGKSTLAGLLTRSCDVTQGSITLGGADLREMRQSDLRTLVSTAPQKSVLFMGTVRENLRMGKPDASDEELLQALDLACAGAFIRTLPDGLDSIVEKSGGNFSGGQKQRLCIARALLKPAAVYVLDDCFSALDFQTDAQVRAAMHPRMADAVTILIAQRISTVRDADLIAVLSGGRLAGLGTHEQLSQSCPVYREILQSQTYQEEAI